MANDNNDVDDTVYIANSAKAWGKGDFETQALIRLVENWSGSVPDRVEVIMALVRNHQGWRGRSIVAEEFIEEQRLLIDGDAFQELKELTSDLGLLAEEALVEADEV